MKVLKIVGIALGALVALFVVVGLFLPGKWSLERSVVTSASPEFIYPRVATPKRWEEWAAWNNVMDPDVKWTFSGPDSGTGAGWSWDGPEMGRGTMTITKADPATGVWLDEMIEADRVNAHGSITWAPEGDKLRITWKDEGELPPVIGGYFKGMLEGMLGEHFQIGLEKLAKAAEADTAAAAKAAAAQPPPPPSAVPAETGDAGVAIAE